MSLGRMIGGSHDARCYIVVSSLLCTGWPNDVCDVAVPCRFCTASHAARACGHVTFVMFAVPCGFAVESAFARAHAIGGEESMFA